MIHPEEIRALVRQGRIPENWRIIRGSGFSAMRGAWGITAWLPSISAIISIIAGFNTLKYFQSSNFNYIIIHSFIYIDLLLLLAVWVIIPPIRAVIARNSALVFLPDGCVQFTNIHSSNPHKYKILAYASIADILLNTSFWTGPCLVVRDREGKKQKWHADPCYGPRGRIFQKVLTAYTIYSISGNAPYMIPPHLQAQVQ